LDYISGLVVSGGVHYFSYKHYVYDNETCLPSSSNCMLNGLRTFPHCSTNLQLPNKVLGHL